MSFSTTEDVVSSGVSEGVRGLQTEPPSQY